MMKIISIINQKGGVGKTTTTSNLGVALANLGKKVLLIDLDPQANLSIGMNINVEESKYTVTKLIKETIANDNCKINISDYIQKREDVDIIPSDIGLSGVEMLLFNTMNRENVLKSIIEEIKEKYDYILIDCMPSLGLLPINALVASDSTIIPVQAQFYSLTGMEQLFETIQKVRRQINKKLSIEGILITMFDKRTSISKEVESALINIYSDTVKVFNSKIQICTKLAEAPSQGQSILSYNPKAEAAKSYTMLAQELISKEV